MSDFMSLFGHHDTYPFVHSSFLPAHHSVCPLTLCMDIDSAY